MFKSPKSIASVVTVVFLALGAVGDAIFGTSNNWWTAIERVINLPVALVVCLVGPGHGPAQLVVPFLFSIGCYWVFFWLLTLGLQKISKKIRPSRDS